MAERTRLADRLGLRLGAAFVVTAVAAVAVLAALALTAAHRGTRSLSAERRTQLADDVAAALATAYAEAGGWDGADLLPAHALAASGGATLLVTTIGGDVVPAPEGAAEYQRRMGPGAPDTGSGPPDPAPGGGDGQDRGREGGGGSRGAAMVPAAAETPAPTGYPRLERAVVVDGRHVGDATLLFVQSDLASDRLQDTLTRTILWATLLAVALALAITGFVTPRLTGPLRRLTRAVRSVAAGERDVTVRGGPGELGRLADAVQRMADDLDRQERVRKAVVADVAHELRTPLAVLRAEIEGMVDGVIDATPAEAVSLQEEVHRLVRLVEDLDAIAAAEAAGLRLERAPVRLDRVAADVAERLSPQLAAGGAAVETDLAPATVIGDTRRLDQIVTNLLTNAGKFSHGGTVTVVVQATGSEAVLDVVDDGPGIPAEERPHVFERFWRGQAGTGVGGSGIGLAVVAELVAAHGGTVAASDAPGRGARLTVRLPLAEGSPHDLHSVSIERTDR